jgi:hypothetical protein
MHAPFYLAVHSPPYNDRIFIASATSTAMIAATAMSNLSEGHHNPFRSASHGQA